ncbi:hypothetical protein BD769DRAFT_1387422 [Suillus cothurnatus]|nr:hypothetical protein BD769DRAFT_1387422 [Suillus cothurnatus]
MHIYRGHYVREAWMSAPYWYLIENEILPAGGSGRHCLITGKKVVVYRFRGLIHELLAFLLRTSHILSAGGQASLPLISSLLLIIYFCYARIPSSLVQAAGILSPPVGSATALGLHAFPRSHAHFHKLTVFLSPAGNTNRVETLACFDLCSSIVRSQSQTNGSKDGGRFFRILELTLLIPLGLSAYPIPDV